MRALASRCSVAGRKSRKLLPVVTTRYLSPRIRGKVYKACVHSAMLHVSKSGDQITLNYDRVLIHWICGTKNRNETLSASLLQKLGIDDFMAVKDTYQCKLLLVWMMAWHLIKRQAITQCNCVIYTFSGYKYTLIFEWTRLFGLLRILDNLISGAVC